MKKTILSWTSEFYPSEDIINLLHNKGIDVKFNFIQSLAVIDKTYDTNTVRLKDEILFNEFSDSHLLESIKLLKNYEGNIYRVFDRYMRANGFKPSLKIIQLFVNRVASYLLEMLMIQHVGLVVFLDTPHHPIDYVLSILVKELRIENLVNKDYVLSAEFDRIQLRFSTMNFPYFDHLPSSYEADISSNRSTLVDDKTTSSYNKKHLGPRWNIQYIFNYSLISIRYNFKKNRFVKIFTKSYYYLYHLTFHQLIKKSTLFYYDIISEKNPNLESNYFYYPLHFQPEATTNPLGESYQNQLEIVRNYSSILKPGWYLYVKEHPSYWHRLASLDPFNYYRSIAYYKDMRKLKNVIIIDKMTSSSDLLLHSKAVISINGTIILEALKNNIFAFCYGNYIYSKFPNSILTPSNQQIIAFQDKIHDHNFEDDYEKLNLYLSKILYPIDLDSSVEVKQKEIFNSILSHIERLTKFQNG